MQYIDKSLSAALKRVQPLKINGRVIHASGTMIRATVSGLKIGELCIVKNLFESSHLFAEVVGFTKNETLLSPIGDISGLAHDAHVYPSGKYLMAPVGANLLGRILDGLGYPMDVKEKGPIKPVGYYPLHQNTPTPLSRRIISKPLCLGLRVMDGLLTCGEGQRLGIYGAAGVGKSQFLATLAKNAIADVNVLALIGERGREVREFIEKDLGEEGMKRSVVVVATSDKSSMERLKAAYTATAIAEYFRDNGKSVLLMIDSITRFARAQREIGLSAGEPPTRRGFPPSVFNILPKLLERAGTSEKGSITGIYTVLVEGDDMNEPVADETRSILDGHIVLSRELAAKNHYPAIDVLNSISRVMNSIVDEKHKKNASKARQIIAKYKEMELLVKVGEYKQGADKYADEAISKIGAVNKFLKQDFSESSNFKQTLKTLDLIVDQ
ncbi:type III secretion system ATPase, FliI/YscN [Desulfosarcina variabilis str. Montpellier]